MTKINSRPKTIGLSNQSLVFEIFDDHEKLTITEITSRVNLNRDLPLSEQSIRRAIDQLHKSGFIKQHGKQNNAVLYGKLSAGFTDSDEGEKLINVGGNLVTVGDFLELIADEENSPHPFIVKVQPQNWAISPDFERKLRKRLTAIVMSASDPGYNDRIKQQAAFLQNHINELEYLIGIMKGFIDSPIWFAHYRDKVALDLRRLQEKQPELWKLANDYIKDK